MSVASAFNDYSGATDKSVTVFCWSRTEPGTAQWAQAETLGRLLGHAGFSVVTGGYCGSMEAVSKGAREAIDADKVEASSSSSPRPQVVGILVPGQFPDRALAGNAFLTEEVNAPNMPRRIEMLTARSRYYVILPGTLGTLMELAMIWGQSLLHHPSLAKPVLVAFRDPWAKVVAALGTLLQLPANNTELIVYVDTPEEAAALIAADFAKVRLGKA
jgi:uncharacterized protein (TIGR00730 family)